jgi:hypothetical protein
MQCTLYSMMVRFNVFFLKETKVARRERVERNYLNQCCGSITFWYGSGSADPYNLLTDADSDPVPATFGSGFQDANTSFTKIKSHKDATKQ